MNEKKPGVTALGAIVSIILVAGLVALGVYMMMGRRGSASPADGTDASAPAGESAAEVTEVQVEVPRLSSPGTVQITDNIVPIEISEYAGYAGLIAANGGLEPSEN